MNIRCSQIYIEPGVNFPFSYIAIKYLDEGISDLVVPSARFIRNYGDDYRLVFNISAKRSLEENEIRGPTVFKRTKDVEYSVFLPFTVIVSREDAPQTALRFLFQGMYAVFDSLEIDAGRVREQEASMIEHVCSDPAMFRRKLLESDAGPVWTVSRESSDVVSSEEG
jgi:hypothetical protein